MGFNEAAGYGAVADHRARDRVHRRALRAATRTVLPRRRLRRRSASGSRPCSCARPTTTPATKPPTTSPRTTTLHEGLSTREVFVAHQLPRAGALVVQPGRARQQPQRRPRLGHLPALLRRRRPLGRAHRHPRRDLPRGLGSRPARHRRPVRPDRPQAAHRRRHAHPGRRHRPHRRDAPASGRGPSAPRCSAPAPPWSTRPCSPRSATSPTPPGGPARSASTDSGATAASPSAPSSPASSPTRSASPTAIWAVAALTAASGVVVAVRMYETHPRLRRTAPAMAPSPAT